MRTNRHLHPRCPKGSTVPTSNLNTIACSTTKQGDIKPLEAAAMRMSRTSRGDAAVRLICQNEQVAPEADGDRTSAERPVGATETCSVFPMMSAFGKRQRLSQPSRSGALLPIISAESEETWSSRCIVPRGFSNRTRGRILPTSFWNHLSESLRRKRGMLARLGQVTRGRFVPAASPRSALSPGRPDAVPTLVEWPPLTREAAGRLASTTTPRIKR